MKYCTSCGAKAVEGAKYCTICGAEILSENIHETSEVVPDIAPDTNFYGNIEKNMELPMNWFKFLIYFSLFAGAIINIGTGMGHIFGYIYETEGVSADLIYDIYGSGLQVLDIIYGIAIIAFGVFCIITRFKLSKYKKEGPEYLLLVYILGTVISSAYLLMTMAIIPPMYLDYVSSEFIGEMIGDGIATVIMVLANRKYFEKRKHMFTY